MYRDSFGDYQLASSYVLDKTKAVDSFVRYMLVRTQAMFEYQGLPDTVPQTALEYLLQTKGSCFVTEVEGSLYALTGSAGGELDVYGEPTKYTVANTALKLSKTFEIGKDGILVKNDAFEIGLLPILQKYGAMLAENTISMRTVLIVLRMVALISASDDNTAASAHKFIKDIEDGKFSAIGESAFFEGIKVHSVANTQNYLMQFIDLEQYIKASCYNEIGLDSNYNMKRANLTEKEVSMNDDFLLPLVDNMIKQRQIALDAINSMYGTDITVDYASSWKIAHAENEKEVALSVAVAEQVESGEIEIRSAEVNNREVGIEGGGKPETEPGSDSESNPEDRNAEPDAGAAGGEASAEDGDAKDPDSDGGSETQTGSERVEPEDETEGSDDDRDKG